MASAQHILSLTMSCVGTMNTDSVVVASDRKLETVLSWARSIRVSGYGHNDQGGYLAWLLTTYLWPNMDTEGSYPALHNIASLSVCEEYELEKREGLALFPIIWEVLAHKALKHSARNIELDAFYSQSCSCPRLIYRLFDKRMKNCRNIPQKCKWPSDA